MNDETEEILEPGTCRVCTHAMSIEDGCEPTDICYLCHIAELEEKLECYRAALEAMLRAFDGKHYDAREMIDVSEKAKAALDGNSPCETK